MVLEELPELEDVQGGLREGEVEQTPQLCYEGYGPVYRGAKSREDVLVILQDGGGLLENWETGPDLESREVKVYDDN